MLLGLQNKLFVQRSDESETSKWNGSRAAFIGVFAAPFCLCVFFAQIAPFSAILRAAPAPGSRSRGGCGSVCVCLQETPGQGLPARLARLTFWLPRVSRGTDEPTRGDKPGAVTSHPARGDARRGSSSLPPSLPPGMRLVLVSAPISVGPRLPGQHQLCPLCSPAQTAL